MTKHVILTVNTAWNIYNFRRPILNMLFRAGHRVTVLAPPDNTVSDLIALGCEVVPLDMDIKGLSPANDLRLVQTYREHFKKLKPDIVLSFTIKNNLFGALAARSLSIPFIPNVTGLGTAFLSNGLLRTVAEILYKICFRGLPTVFFQNEEDQDLFTRRALVKKDQAKLLPGSGIDLEKFSVAPYPTAEEPIRFLLIARLLKDKGIQEYVDAARRVKQKQHDVVFQLLGPMGIENRTAVSPEELAAWQEEGIVEYLGETKDVRPYISNAHCIVLPSYREGAPRTLIEAAAMARPVVATDVPGCRSVIEDNKTGFLCIARNERSLAEACSRFMYLSHENKVVMGNAGREKMLEQYDQSIVVASYKKAMTDQLCSV